ncbi:MAG TPA: hypothetical protein VIH61_08655 [Waddliaceae bacterium]
MKTLEQKVAYLEFVQDQLISEIEEVNELLIAVGFPQGIKSIIVVANELIQDGVGQQDER